MPSTQMQKVIKARTGLVLDEPFFGSLAMRLELIEDESIPTAATNGSYIKFNPMFVDELSLSELKAVIAHEIMHLALQHHTRRGIREHTKWNIAGDYVINLILDDANFELPTAALLDKVYAEKTTDTVYGDLPDSPPGGGRGGGGGGGGGGQDPGGMGTVEDPTGADGKPSTAELRKSEEDWKIATAQAAKVAKGQGKLPGSLERFVEAMLQPDVNWKDVLREFVEQSVKGDYSWLRPNRRHICSGIYLPTLDSKCIGNIVVTIDTSGSVSQGELEKFASEISAILVEFDGIEADVYYVDTKICGHPEHFTPDDLPIRFKMRGGGGTDFAPVFDHLEKKCETPTCLIYFSDMWCSRYPKNTPDYPVLWVNTTEELHYGHPPFGQVLYLDMDK